MAIDFAGLTTYLRVKLAAPPRSAIQGAYRLS
jgi:hypothetical protein